jgi:hypothetical protein
MLESVGHVVIRNVSVGGDVLGVFNKVDWVRDLHSLLGRYCGRDGRHAWRRRMSRRD